VNQRVLQQPRHREQVHPDHQCDPGRDELLLPAQRKDSRTDPSESELDADEWRSARSVTEKSAFIWPLFRARAHAYDPDGTAYQPEVVGAPLNGPTISSVIQPP